MPAPAAASKSGPAKKKEKRCKICDTPIPRGLKAMAEHCRSDTHQDRARELGVLCPCGKNLLDPVSFPWHRCIPHGNNSNSDAAAAASGSVGSPEEAAISAPPLPGRPQLNCTGCAASFRTESKFFAHHASIGCEGVHSPVWTSPPDKKKHPRGACRPCGVVVYQRGSLKEHKKMQSHIDLFTSKGLYCASCKKSFKTDESTRTHWLHFHDPDRPTEFRCCDCLENFHTDRLLKRHKCPCAPPEGYYPCEPCDRRFASNWELNLHLTSNDHRPVKCLGGGGCTRKFKSLPGMIQHLESGACKSKIDRMAIDALLRKHDTANVITIKGAREPATLPSWPSTSQISSTASSSTPTVFEEVDTDSDDEGSGGVIFTPTSSTPRRGSIDSSDMSTTPRAILTPTSSDSYSFTGIATPLSGATGGTVSSWPADPLVCPVCWKKFKRTGRLASHLASPVHATPIYHCPKGFLEEMGIKVEKHGGVEKKFKTLSGLASHIQMGACSDDKNTWEKAVKFLEEKLRGLGFDGLRLLTQ